MAGTNLDFTKLLQPKNVYQAFSGANIYAVVGDRRLGTLQAVTCSITRETAALYGMGDPNPKAFVQGKRGIAGTLVFTQFDRHALMGDVFSDSFNKPLAQQNALFQSRFLRTDLDSGKAGATDSLLNGAPIASRNFDASFGSQIDVNPTGALNSDIKSQLTTLYGLVSQQRVIYSDQIPEFDITVSMINEAGDVAFAVIGGVKLVNEGWGYTMDDLVSEMALTYVARKVIPLTNLANQAAPDGGFQIASR